MVKSKLRNKILKKYNLVEGEKITVGRLTETAEEENIELQDLIFILGCYQNAKYKQTTAYATIRTINNYDERKQVKLIKIDLKYLDEYGSRMYSKSEVIAICNEYNVELEDFLTYLYNYRICYYENSYILEMNKEGIWIGENIELSDKFINKNYEILSNRIDKLAKKMTRLYMPKISKEDLEDVGMNCALKYGKIEKNFAFHTESEIIEKLVFKAKYAMLEKIMESFKTTNVDNISEVIGQVDRVSFDNVEVWLYPIKLKKIEKMIIDNIELNIDEILKNRKHGLCKIYKKLDMKYRKFYSHIEEIAQKLIEENKVRLCSNGEVMIKGEEV